MMKRKMHPNSLKNLRGKEKPVIWNEIEYPSIKAMAEAHNISATNVRHKIINDRPLKGYYVDYKL